MHLYKILGYKGIAPFVVIAGLLFVLEQKEIAAIIQMAYACAILSFLAGMHWAHALPRDDHKQVFLSMQPTILSMFCFVLAVVTGHYGVFLALIAFGFPALYRMDVALLEAKQLPDGYLGFRKNVTVVVTIAMLLSALSFYI